MTAASIEADAIGCEWALSSNSWAYPGFTFRIVLFQRSENRRHGRTEGGG